MPNKTRSVLSYVFASLMLAALACNGGLPPKDLSTQQVDLPPVIEEAVPTQAVMVTPPLGASLDGEWNGKTSADTDFLIQVTGNQVTYFNFSYVIQSGSCNGSGGFGDMVNVPIIDNKFTIEWKNEAEAKLLTISGTFGADGKASGTINYSENNKVCGEITIPMAWNALSESAVAAGEVLGSIDQPSGQVGYDGSWDGTNSEGNQVSFKVENNQVKSIILNYSVNTNGCFYSGASGGPTENGTISDNSFSVNYTDSDGNLFTFSGSFTSDTEAAGTFHVKGSASGFCGAFETDMNWTAKNK